MSPLIASVVAGRLATIHELETVYSYSDALDMGEILTTRAYNEWARTEKDAWRRSSTAF